MQDRFFSDEDLVAFLDQEHAFAPVDAIEAALPHDRALQKRLEALSIDRDALKEAFGELTPDNLLLPTAPPKPRPSRLWAMACAASVVGALAIGVVIGSARSSALTGWADYVAAYQALYSTSTLAHIETSPDVQQAELDRVGASIGKALSVDQLTVFPDVQYARAQILSFGGQALIQLAFLTSTGDPLALCIIRSGDVPETGPEILEMEGLSTARWAQNGYDYILIGGQDDALISRMSRAFAGMEI